MKRKIVPITVTVLLIALIVSVIVIEKNNMAPTERFEESSQSTDNNEQDSSNMSENSDVSDISEATDTQTKAIINNTHTAQYEFLSYDIVEDTDIADQTKYKGEYFDDSPAYNAGLVVDYYLDGHIPNPNYLKKYIDFEAMERDIPELYEYHSSNGTKGMTDSEYQKLMDNPPEKYITFRHPKTKYLFLHCRVTNVSDDELYEPIHELIVIGRRGDDYVGGSSWLNYYDYPRYEGKGLAQQWYHFEKAGDVLECVIGWEITEDEIDFSEDTKYYVGFLPVGSDSDEINPAMVPSFVEVNSLPRE